MNLRSARVAVLLSVAILPAACQPDSDSRDPDPVSPLVDPLPAVQSTIPGLQSTGWGLTQAISVRFTETMDPQTLTAASFTLATAAGYVTGSVSTTADLRSVVFTASDSLAELTLHTATVSTAIRSATGQNLAAAYSWTFTTGPRYGNWLWTTPVLLEDSDNEIPESYSGPDLAMDELENSVVVWRQSNGSSNRVFATRSVAGAAWESPAEISGGSNDYTPQVEIYGAGEILAAWSTGYTIWCTRAGMTGAWASPVQAATSATWTVRLLDLHVDSAGNAFLFYYEHQTTPTTANLFMVRCDATGSWESPTALPLRHTHRPGFALAASGFAVMVWSTLDGIVARKYLPGTGWTGDEIVEPYDAARPAGYPLVAMDESGKCLAIWVKLVAGSPVEWEIFHSRVTETTGWTAAEIGPAATLRTHGSYQNMRDVVRPALAPDGTAMLTWVDQVGWRCWASRQSADGAWGTPQAIDMNTPNHSMSTGTAFFIGEGRFVVLGEESIYDPVASYGALWINEFNPATGWGTPTRLRTAVGYIGGFSLATDFSGRAAAVWMESNASANNGGIDMWWSRYR